MNEELNVLMKHTKSFVDAFSLHEIYDEDFLDALDEHVLEVFEYKNVDITKKDFLCWELFIGNEYIVVTIKLNKLINKIELSVRKKLFDEEYKLI